MAQRSPKEQKTNRLWPKLPQIQQGILVTARILDLNSQIILMALILLRKVRRMLKVARLPTYSDSRLQIERPLVCFVGVAPGFSLDETVETRYIFELGIGVKEEGSMI